jgi:hypothetical protein
MVFFAALAVACGGNQGPSAPVPQTMNDALTQFLAAVKANDLTHMGQLWGTEQGPAAGFMDSKKLRERLTVIQKYLENAGYRIVEGPLLVPGHDELRTYRVELQHAKCNEGPASTTSTVPQVRVQPIDLVRTRSGGWLVYDVHLESSGTPGTSCLPATGTGTRP